MKQNLSLLIELPTWIGDSVMATPTIEAMLKYFSPSKVTLVGSSVSIALFKNDTRFTSYFVDDTKKSKRRFRAVKILAKELGPHDIAISFRSTFFSHLLLYFTNSTRTIAKKSSWLSKLFLTDTTNVNVNQHYVQRYYDLFAHFFPNEDSPQVLKLSFSPIVYTNPTIAIVPGAAYGSAKRWYPNEYAKVAKALSQKYDIILLGGKAEEDIGNDIFDYLHKESIHNVTNLVGKTSIPELVNYIANLSLFIGGDSGPMHIAAATQTPTIAIYGPTDHRYSHPWKNEQHIIVRKELSCSPCAKRTCPFKHHECMTSIKANDVLSAAYTLLN